MRAFFVSSKSQHPDNTANSTLYLCSRTSVAQLDIFSISVPVHKLTSPSKTSHAIFSIHRFESIESRHSKRAF